MLKYIYFRICSRNSCSLLDWPSDKKAKDQRNCSLAQLSRPIWTNHQYAYCTTIYILEKRWTKCRGGVTSTGISCSRKLVEMGEGKKSDEQWDLGALYVDKPIENEQGVTLSRHETNLPQALRSLHVSLSEIENLLNPCLSKKWRRVEMDHPSANAH